MPDKIEVWLDRLHGHEGEYSNRSPEDDPGGETKWGISKREYPDIDIKGLSLREASAIYKKDYLEPFDAFKLRDGVLFQLFDFAVHSGIRNAIKQMQTVLDVEVDGVIGMETRKAMAARTESDLVMLILSARLYYLASLKNWPSNSRGWTRRVARNLYYGAEDTD